MVTGDGKRPWWSCAIRLEACAKYRTKAEVEDAGPISQLPSGCPPKSTLLDVSTLNVGLASDWKEQVVDRLRLRLVSRRATAYRRLMAVRTSCGGAIFVESRGSWFTQVV